MKECIDRESAFELLKKYNLAGGGYWNLERPFLQSHMIMNVMFDIEEK